MITQHNDKKISEIASKWLQLVENKKNSEINIMVMPK